MEHNLHGKRRAAVSPLFSIRAVASFDIVVRDQLEILSDVFQKAYKSGKVLKLRNVFVAFATDAVHQYALNESMNLQKDEQRTAELMQTILSLSKITPLVKQFSRLPALSQKMPIWLNRALKPEMATFLEIHKVSPPITNAWT